MNVIRALLVVLFASPLLGNDLVGLWESRLRFGPDIRGPLTIARDADGWRGEIAGRSTAVKVEGDQVTMIMDEGDFYGRFDKSRAKIIGHWVQGSGGLYASPVTLTVAGESLWRGEVVPRNDEFRVYLKIAPRENGTMSVFLRNPERNFGVFWKLDTVERSGDTIKFKSGHQVRTEGTLRDGVLTVPLRGGTYDFRRVQEGRATDFYRRGRPAVPYIYRPPRPRDDGWAVATVDEVGISREAITKFIRMIIDTPIDKANTLELHGVLIARHGKLVVEEYFHGEHGDKPHDSRSASKSLTSTLIGAAIHAGVPLEPSSSVYEVMNKPADDPRKRALTLEHLLTMTSGFYCDDNDENAPGNEDKIQEQQQEPDYYKLALNLPMESDPGSHPVYCSIAPHLAGGVLSRAAGRSLPELFHELIAVPMQMNRYHMNLAPTLVGYMGGGLQFLPRDMIKLAQLHMDGGVWNGRRIISEEWARRATSPLVSIGKRGYGYLWWVDERQYNGRKIKTYMAGGNGGQIAMAIPELDLVIGFWGGSYNDRVLFVPQNEYVEQWILPAVAEAK